MAIKKIKSNSGSAFPSATAELVVKHYDDLFRSDPDFVTREKVFDSVKDNRKAGLDLFREYCSLETNLSGDESSLSAREELEFSSLSPVFLSAFGIDFSSDVTPEDDVLDLLLSVVPDPVVPDVIRQCLEEDGIPLGNNPSGERIRISVASLGEGAVQRLLEANADAFIRNLPVEAYRNAMRFLSVEAEGDAYCKVFRKLFADESNARREALLAYFYSVRSTFPEDSIVKRLGFSATAYYTVNDWLKSVVGDQPYFMSSAVRRDYGIESLERKSVINIGNSFPKSVLINYSDGRKKRFFLGEFNVKDTVLLVSAMQQELNSRSLFFVNVTPDKVGDFMDVLKKHSLDQVFDVRLSSANNAPLLSVNGVNYLVPEEGIYFVYNRDFVSGVYRRDAFETLFKVEPNGVRCTPVRNSTGMNSTTGLSRKKSGQVLN